VQDEITEQVVGTIAGSYGVISRARFAEVKEKPTELLDAYECVLQAMAYYRGSPSETEHEQVRGSLERAVKSDPVYADAWAFLSFIYLDEYRFNLNPQPDSLDRALDVARRAVALDATSQVAHGALAQVYFHRRELDAFFPEAERTIALNPNETGALAGLAIQLYVVDNERGIALARKAMKLDPLHPTALNMVIADYHFQRGKYEEALAEARKVDVPGFFLTQLYLAAIYAELGRQSEAQSAVEELLELSPGFSIASLIEDRRKWNAPDDSIRHWASALRKAGLPEGTEA
jgi:adenylate cyclase